MGTEHIWLIELGKEKQEYERITIYYTPDYVEPVEFQRVSDTPGKERAK